MPTPRLYKIRRGKHVLTAVREHQAGAVIRGTPATFRYRPRFRRTGETGKNPGFTRPLYPYAACDAVSRETRIALVERRDNSRPHPRTAPVLNAGTQHLGNHP